MTVRGQAGREQMLKRWPVQLGGWMRGGVADAWSAAQERAAGLARVVHRVSPAVRVELFGRGRASRETMHPTDLHGVSGFWRVPRVTATARDRTDARLGVEIVVGGDDVKGGLGGGF